MADPTAPANATLTFVTATSTGTVTPIDFEKFRALVQGYAVSSAASSSAIPGQATITAGAPVASWLGAIERRLNASIGLDGSPDLKSGTHLSKEIVAAATSFFAATSYMLPAEPHLYAIPSGELVAEFDDGGAGRMTIVISDKNALALAVVDGHAVYKDISLIANTSSDLQRDLASVTSRLDTEKHASMDPRR
jgi:hypothetical protein